MRKTIEKKCFECEGVGLEVKMMRLFSWKRARHEILNNSSNVVLYTNYVCKVCQGKGVYEVLA